MPKAKRICHICQKEFTPIRSKSTLCSIVCRTVTLRNNNRAKSAATLIDRFWSKVNKSPDGCWLWQGNINTSGYGRFNGFTTHRFSYELANGPIPQDLWVLHHCDVRNCVNPAHLFLGTNLDNMRDMWAKGRAKTNFPLPIEKSFPRTHPEKIRRGANHHFYLHPEWAARGEATGHTKLTEQQVKDIRTQYAKGGTSYPKLGKAYGVSAATIGLIIQGRNWKHLL